MPLSSPSLLTPPRRRRWATFVGLGILLITTPITSIFMKKIVGYRREMLKYTDQVGAGRGGRRGRLAGQGRRPAWWAWGCACVTTYLLQSPPSPPATACRLPAATCPQRVKLMNQLLVGIRVLKMYAWEVSASCCGTAPGPRLCLWRP